MRKKKIITTARAFQNKSQKYAGQTSFPVLPKEFTLTFHLQPESLKKAVNYV
jgi:hypothetical protein